jgi:hypothetical protein
MSAVGAWAHVRFKDDGAEGRVYLSFGDVNDDEDEQVFLYCNEHDMDKPFWEFDVLDYEVVAAA